ncbi:MAG: hypothetical protein IJM83_09325 [Firmicutes bacterium]|nr:hypothetical protein [Lachnospiraceae bacterium]MBQ7059480.1 hypothetical protein [Bacillota bacterium]
MDKFVPLGKKSKKEQKKFHARQRKTWEGISPVTRTVPNGKAYNRRSRKRMNDEAEISETEYLLFSYKNPLEFQRIFPVRVAGLEPARCRHRGILKS